MSVECEKVGGINLAQGVCDTPVPSAVREAAHEVAIENGANSYTRFDGLEQLREAIARKLRTFNKIEADPEAEIVVSAGSTGAFYCTCLALLDPGDFRRFLALRDGGLDIQLARRTGHVE